MENGITFAVLSAVYSKIKIYYGESYLAAFISKVAAVLKGLFENSSIWNAVSRRERTTRYFRESLAWRMSEKAMQAVTGLARYFGAAISNSITGIIIMFFIQKPVIMPGIYLLIQTIVPHHYWYNWMNLGLALLVLVLYIVKCSVDREYELSLKSFDFTVLFYFLVGAISALTSIIPSDSIRIFTLNIISFLIVIIIINAVKTKQDLVILLAMLCAGIVISSLYGFWQYAMGIEVDVRLVDTTVSGSLRRLFSTMGNPNNYAEYLVAVMPFFAALFLGDSTIRRKLFISGLFLLPLMNLIMTSSRSSWLGFAFAVLVFTFFVNRKVLPLLFLGGIISIPFLPHSIKARIMTIGRDSSSRYRLQIWDGAFKMLKDYWLTGIGQGPAPFIALFRRYSTLPGVVHSHMLPLQIWLELGIAGVATFVWMVIRFFKKTAALAFGDVKDPFFKYVSAAAMSGIAGLLLVGMFEYIWFYPRIISIFWILTGILMVSLRLGGVAETGDTYAEY